MWTFFTIKSAMTTMTIQHYWVQFTSKSICINSVLGMFKTVTTKSTASCLVQFDVSLVKNKTANADLKNKTKMFMSNNQNSSKDTTVQSGQ